ncbi:MAG TPA: SpaA isopeptide-forming pilin-related protein [Vicinamibacterales bacterium]
MHRVIALGLTAALIVTAVPSAVLAGAQSAGTVTGVARGRQLQSLTGVRVQIRSAGTGQIVGTTTTTEGGAFSFAGLPPGDYISEVVDAAGKVQGVGAPFTVSNGGTASTSVVALSYGAGAATSSGGFSLFGMGPVASMSVLGAAAAASVAAVTSTRPDASPSR